MRRSRRTAAAVSALAIVASGLVSAAVIGVGPALADHCDPAAEASQQAQQSQSPTQQQQQRQAPDGQDQQQDQQAPDGQDQQQAPDNQDQQQDQGQQQDQQQQGGGALLAAPTPQPDGQDTAAPDDQQAPPDDQGQQDQGQQDQQDQGQQDQGQQQDQQQLRRRGNNNNNQNPTQSASPTPSATGTGQEENCGDLGPSPEDFVDIRQVGRGQLDNFRPGRNGSRGTFVSACGTNGNKHNNPDNFIVAPGVSNGAHHLHDYVGNLTTDGFSTDQSLAAGGTTCRFGDKSTYFWPVLRDRKSDANSNDPDGNVGQVLRARSVTLQFRGNASSRVTAMPRFLRLIMGDAKAATNGGANARAAWSCTGFQNRITNDKYPLCPRGSQVLRILDFPSCWDGQNTDSANHRTHVVFPGQGGACPQGTRAIPQLRMTLSYSVPQGPSYAVDSFPEQKHNPVTDHADFANVMSDQLMSFVVNCINRGRRC